MGKKRNISSTKLKQAVLVFFFLLFFAPMMQQQFKIVQERNLENVDNSISHPTFSFSRWFSGAFQKELEPTLDVNIGFRKTMVRLQNEINYRVFNISKAGSVIIGKHGYLFVENYVNATNGADFIGSRRIDIMIEKATVVQRELKKKNIDLVFSIAPGKGSYFSEYIPINYYKKTDTTNYNCFASAFAKSELHFLDLHHFFISNKTNIKHPVFSQIGVHWSDYAAFLAADTISKYISQLRDIKMPEIYISKIEHRDSIKRTDKDAAGLMNLFSSPQGYTLPYLTFFCKRDSASIRPQLLTVADSYFSTIVATSLVDSLFSDWDYWIYERRNASEKKGPFNFKNEIEKRDVILILATDASLSQFPFNFINEAYEVYAPKDKSYKLIKDKEFRFFVAGAFKSIQKNKVWKNDIKRAAKELRISYLDQCINVALWLYQEQELKNKKFI
ncbi:MAG: hypothetical protein IPP64_00500 [Bacteroidetes bacterium]|nr:hypothetical protein [Bacteroidota bacterium]